MVRFLFAYLIGPTLSIFLRSPAAHSASSGRIDPAKTTQEPSTVASPYQLQQRRLARIRASLGYGAKRAAPPRLPPFVSQTLITDSEKRSAEFESEIER